MTTPLFFESNRARFFRPVSNSRRELVAACLRVLYERLHGPAADHAHNLNRESLRELILPAVRTYQDKLDLTEGPDEFDEVEGADPAQITTIVIRALVRDGWLEQFPDRQGLLLAFRFSRPGKLFSEAFWALDRPSRSRQRNMRGCRNALEAALSSRGDAHDLIDAYEYAEKVIEDLTEGIDYLQERIRHLMQEASVQTHWGEFVEFLERFERDYAKQLTADSATLNRYAIRQKLEALQVELDSAKFNRIENQLQDIAPWLVEEHTGSSVLEWLILRIDDIVNAACESKQPGLVKAMSTYIKRVTGLVQQSMMLRAGRSRHAYLSAIQSIAALDRSGQDSLLVRIGEQMASVEVRLLDPSSFKIPSAAQKRRAATVTIPPRASRYALLQAALRTAESGAFAVPNESIAKRLRADLRLYQHPIRLSSLPTITALDVTRIMQTVEAVRTSKGKDLVAVRLPGRVGNKLFTAFDFEINFKDRP